MKLIYILKCSLLHMYVGDGLTVGFLNRFGKSLFLEPFGVGFQRSDKYPNVSTILHVSCMYLDLSVCISHQDTSTIKIHQDTSRLYISDQDTTRIHAHVVDVRVHTALAHVGFSTYRGIGNILPRDGEPTCIAALDPPLSI